MLLIRASFSDATLELLLTWVLQLDLVWSHQRPMNRVCSQRLGHQTAELLIMRLVVLDRHWPVDSTASSDA